MRVARLRGIGCAGLRGIGWDVLRIVRAGRRSGSQRRLGIGLPGLRRIGCLCRIVLGRIRRRLWRISLLRIRRVLGIPRGRGILRRIT